MGRGERGEERSPQPHVPPQTQAAAHTSLRIHARTGQGVLFAPQCPRAQHHSSTPRRDTAPEVGISLCSAQDAAGNVNLCFKGTRSAPPKGCTSPERDRHLPGPASPQGSTARPGLPHWLWPLLSSSKRNLIFRGLV